jgi:hypothetical protein
LTIFVRVAKFPPHQDEAKLLTNLLIRGCGRENGKPAEIACPLLDANTESDVARPKQSEPSLGLDRRQLLAATAVVTAAGIMPNAEAVGTTNSAQAVNGAKISLSENSALNVCVSMARRIEEIAVRNRIREEARLPLLSIPKELRKINSAEIAAEFEEFAAVHRP